jgi:CCR4-NOT transcription complex subunit 1
MPHQLAQAQQEASLQAPAVPGAQAQLDGFLEATNPREKVETLLSELQQTARGATEEHVKDLGRETQILQTYNQLLRTILTSPNGEELTRFTAIKVCNILYSQAEKALEIEVLVHLLSKLCELSAAVARYIWVALGEAEDSQVLNAPVTLASIDAGLIDIRRLDISLAKMMHERNVAALELLSAVMDRVLLSDEPSALRSDFTASLGALNQWMNDEPDLEPGKELIRKLRESGIPEVITPLLNDQLQSKRDQIEYIFSEWLTIYKYPAPNDQTYRLFLKDMHQRQVINNQEDSTFFFRLLVDLSVAASEHEYQNIGLSSDEAFLHIDALAKMIVLLVKFQGEANGAVKTSKPAYLNSILSLLVLVLNHHQVMRGENFNQRAFFRLFSSILCEYAASGLQQTEHHKEMMLVFADRFLALQPKHIPGFVYGWLSLISHRVFMAGMLTLPEQAVSPHPTFLTLLQSD